jgi:hypothetical protein
MMTIPEMTINEQSVIEEYKDYVKNELDQKKDNILGNKLPHQEKLSGQEIALIAYYEGKIIAPDKGKLYQHFLYYSKRDNRIGVEGTRKKTSNKIVRIKKVIPYLSFTAQKVANDEVNILISVLDKETF